MKTNRYTIDTLDEISNKVYLLKQKLHKKRITSEGFIQYFIKKLSEYQQDGLVKVIVNHKYKGNIILIDFSKICYFINIFLNHLINKTENISYICILLELLENDIQITLTTEEEIDVKRILYPFLAMTNIIYAHDGKTYVIDKSKIKILLPVGY